MTARDLILIGDARECLRTLPRHSVHCIVTSPPYLWLRNYGVDGQIGLEKTMQEYLEAICTVFHEAHRVLHPSGTLWLNIGDSYAGGGRGPTGHNGIGDQERRQGDVPHGLTPDGLKPKDLMGMPWRVALALQSAGWWLRSDIIWHKPNPMPSSIKDRPCQSHEYLFLLSKSSRYYYDWWDTREAGKTKRESGNKARKTHTEAAPESAVDRGFPWAPNGKRGRRSVWTVQPRPYRDGGKHFATFPPALVEPCVRAGTSEHGCCSECGAPWERILEPSPEYAKFLGRDWAAGVEVDDSEGRGHFLFGDGRESTTRRTKRQAPTLTADYLHKGWRPTCAHDAPVTPCTVLDPFSGMATTGLVARSLGRAYVGIELSPEYAAHAERRLSREPNLFTGRSVEMISLDSFREEASA